MSIPTDGTINIQKTMKDSLSGTSRHDGKGIIIPAGPLPTWNDELGKLSKHLEENLKNFSSEKEEEIVKEKKFRVQAKNFAITYSRCEIKKDEMLKHLLSIIPIKQIKLIEIGRELHKDKQMEGETPQPYHLHIRLELLYTYNCKNPNWLDYPIDVPNIVWNEELNKMELSYKYHPNIQGCKNRKAWSNYIRKEDLEPLTWGTDDPYPEPEGFVRKKNDYDTWLQYQEFKKLKIWDKPIKIEANGIKIMTDIGSKKRHIWIAADSSWGKTEFIENTFEGYQIYKPQKGSDYRFDHYEGENIIIYDDIIPKLEELIDVSNVYKTKTPVYGKTRFHTKFWPLRQERIMIVISNTLPIYENNDAFKSRFVIADLRTNKSTIMNQYEGDGREELKNALWQKVRN